MKDKNRGGSPRGVARSEPEGVEDATGRLQEDYAEGQLGDAGTKQERCAKASGSQRGNARNTPGPLEFLREQKQEPTRN